MRSGMLGHSEEMGSLCGQGEQTLLTLPLPANDEAFSFAIVTEGVARKTTQP